MKSKRVYLVLVGLTVLALLFLTARLAQVTANPTDPGTTVQFTQSTYNVDPSAITVPITVTLNDASSVLVAVDYRTVNGTALAGTDYISKSGTLVFNPTFVEQSFEVTILQPNPGSQREFIVQLFNAQNAELGTQSSAIVTLGSGSPPPTPVPGVHDIYLPTITHNRPIILTDLLLNPDFEEGYDESHPTYNGEWRNNILTPNDWLAWWEEEDSSILYHMDNPEMLPVDITVPYYTSPVLRVHSGDWSYKFIRQWGNYNAGFLQVVENLPPGGLASFSYYAHAWCCNVDDVNALSCVPEDHFWFKVGIDPTGAIDPWSSDIVWSEPYYIFDIFEEVGPIQAVVGAEGKVTVYIAAHTLHPYKYNDAYIDSAELTVTIR